MLSDNMGALGLLGKHGQEYSLTEESAKFLDRRSPACVAGVAGFLTLPKLMDGYRNIAEVVRGGQNALGGQGTLEPENPIWVDFARSMGPLQMPFAEAIAQTLRPTRDKMESARYRGGTRNIRNRRSEAQSERRNLCAGLAAVLKVAQEHARKAGVEGRYHTIPGSVFEVDLGSGYDVVLLTGFLHHFDPATIEKLLKRIHGALAPNGRVVTLEFVPNDDRVTPPVTAAWAINMLVTTPQGDAYPFSEYDRMFRSAGFSSNELIRVPGPEALIVSKK